MKNRNIFPRLINKLTRRYLKKDVLPIILSYRSYVEYMCKQSQPVYKRYPCVMPSWDNSSRKKGNFLAFKKSTPFLYYKWLKHVVDNFIPFSKEENLIFINAWNEYLYSMILMSSSDKTTISVAVKTLEGADILNWGSLMAACAIVVVPSIIFFCFIQNKMAGGLSDGAVK